jgi:hypothetical protein
MIGRRGFLRAVFGAAAGVVTRQVGNVVEALATRKAANQVLSFVTVDEILDAKMFFIPYIPLMMPVSPKVKESLYAEGQLSATI